MHEYYRSNLEKLKKEMVKYLSPITEEIEDELSIGFKTFIEKVWEIYSHDMVEKFPYIGGDKASGTGNLTGAYAFVAFGVFATRNGMTLDRWGELSTIAYGRYFDKMPKVMPAILEKAMKHPNLVKKMLKKKDEKNRKNNEMNPGSFLTRTDEGNEEYPIIYNTIQCPLSDFAMKYGYTEYLPYLCNLDYVMFEKFKVPFYRHNTCADGDEICDFKFKPGAPLTPSWPCHSIDPDDPLK